MDNAGNAEKNTLGKYHLLAELGHGGMADVYLALVRGPAGFNKLQVLKCIKNNLAEDPDFVAMFLDEARLAARLNHPHVVQTNEVDSADGRHFIAMEYLEGQPIVVVQRRLRDAKKELPLPIALRILCDTLDGLHYAHELRDFDGVSLSIVHRDVTPHNIFVTYDGQSKVVDFGVAKARTSCTETRAGVIKGKVAYLSPEQAMSQPVDRRADIFAVGVLLWELLCKRRMWKTLTDYEILKALCDHHVPTAKACAIDAPKDMIDVCDKALAPYRDDRYATALEFQQAIEEYLGQKASKASHRDVSLFVSDMFQDKREAIRTIIDQRITAICQRQPAELALPNISPMSLWSALSSSSGSSNATPVTGPSCSNAASDVRATARTAASTQPPPAMRRRRLRRQMMVAGAVVAMSLVGVAGAFFMLGKSKRSSAAASAALRAAVMPSVSVSAITSVSTMDFSVDTDPLTATVMLDDRPLPSNPYHTEYPQSTASHKVAVSAPGYETRVLWVVFDQDVALHVPLNPVPSASAKPAASAGPIRGPATRASEKNRSSPPKQGRQSLDKDDPWK